MPMQDYSTLIYFVNNIQHDVETEMFQAGFEPSERSVTNILDFARSYDVVETESTGFVDINLN